jgi:F420-non-reducing hydrogenase small subunit
MSENGKPKLAMYWASSCGGCEIAVLNIGEHILTVDAVFDVAFFPCIADFKVKDVRSYPDGHIDLCLFNGAIRNSENEEMAHLLRQKSKVLVAFGSCAYEGCIPALSNLTSKDETFQTVYLDNPSIDNPQGFLPQPSFQAAEGELVIPVFYNTVKSLGQVVDVDYIIPGCPPEPHQIWAVLQVVVAALTEGAALPPPGSIVGAGSVAVCEECERVKQDKAINRESCAWVWQLVAVAGRFAPKWAWVVAVVMVRLMAWKIRVRRCWRRLPLSSTWASPERMRRR